MKGLMFNNKYGLEDAVLNGTKTMTRRNIRIPNTFNGIFVAGFKKWTNSLGQWFTELYDEDERSIEGSELKPPYEIGEIVAVKQAYKHTNIDFIPCDEKGKWGNPKGMSGWTNKMFVKNEIMPHLVKITNIILQRLQDIPNEDCLKEGIKKGEFINTWDKFYYDIIGDCACHNTFNNPSKAFASLIDKVSGKGTWNNNDWVWAIEFELIK